MRERIYLSSPHMGGEEMKYIKEAFDLNWIAPLGKNVDGLEKDMCEYIGRSNSVALSSGSAAIHLGLKYLGVGDGDIVFCTSFTFSGSCNAIDYVNAKPVFIDSEYETYNMSADALEKAYLKYPNPKALIIVNLYGNPANYDALLKIARAHNTPVLEDAAESLGSKYKGVQTGNFGDISIFSFNGNKIITTSGGGMLMASDEKTSKKVLFWATQSRENFPWYQHEEIGYNYRLSNISAGIGRGQIKVLDERVAKKNYIYNFYKKAFANNKYITLIPEPQDTEPNHWLTVITLTKDCPVKYMDILNALAKDNIESRPAWKPMHLQPVFKDCDFFSALESGSVSEDLFNRSICIPSDTKLKDDDLQLISDIINDVTLNEGKYV